MISDIVRYSLKVPSPLIPVASLLGNSEGSRMPEIDSAFLTPAIAERIAKACPTSALSVREIGKQLHLRIDYGECIGCGRCVELGENAVRIATRFSRCGVTREGLVRQWNTEVGTETTPHEIVPESVSKEIHSLLGRALNIRQLDAGSCNGCEAEITGLTNPYYDLERFGIHFVASPKHADMLLVTGPVTRNMAEAAKNTYQAVPAPKLVVAVGACGCSGGIFAGSHAIVGGVDACVPVDGYIPGCPPTPAMLITGILEVLRRCLPKMRVDAQREKASLNHIKTLATSSLRESPENV